MPDVIVLRVPGSTYCSSHWLLLQWPVLTTFRHSNPQAQGRLPETQNEGPALTSVVWMTCPIPQGNISHLQKKDWCSSSQTFLPLFKFWKKKFKKLKNPTRKSFFLSSSMTNALFSDWNWNLVDRIILSLKPTWRHMKRRRVNSSWITLNCGIFGWSLQINYRKNKQRIPFLKSKLKTFCYSNFHFDNCHLNLLKFCKDAFSWESNQTGRKNYNRRSFFCKTDHLKTNTFSVAQDFLQHLYQAVSATIKFPVQWIYLSI